MYKPFNDDTSVLGEAGKDFPNQNECKKSKKCWLNKNCLSYLDVVF